MWKVDNTKKCSNIHSVKFNVTTPNSNYNGLTNIPSINGVKLIGDLTTDDLNIEGVKYDAGENIIIKNGVISAIIPVKVSDLENDSNFVNEEQVSNYIKLAIGEVSAVQLVVLESLPEFGSKDIIYLISEDNINYDQYIWVDNKYILIGTSRIDLSDYYTKDEVDKKIQNEQEKLSKVALTGSYNDLLDKPENQEITPATKETLGGVIVGEGLSINDEGVLSTKVAEQDTFIFEQEKPSTTWLISHNMNKYPSVTTVDSTLTAVIGEIRYIDNNNLLVIFSSPFTGKAYLN